MNKHKKQLARLARRKHDYDTSAAGKGEHTTRPGSMNSHKAYPKGTGKTT